MSLVLALDQGTSSSRAVVFDERGAIRSIAQREFRQIFPQPGWVEHDPFEIRDTQFATAREAVASAGIARESIKAVAIVNQRETTIVWERSTGRPIHNAIVWQDRRTEPICESIRARGLAPLVAQRTGLVVDPYFSASKIRWLLEHVPGAHEKARRGELAFGTVDSWLVWQLTGGAVHATDVSNASRTMLYDIGRGQWDDELLDVFDIPRSMLPEVYPSSHVLARSDADMIGGAWPIAGIAGDQPAALFGQACFREGMAKNTYGTGCFLLMNAGESYEPSRNGLLVSLAAQSGPVRQYAREGSVFIGGAVVQWLRDGLRAIEHSSDVAVLAASVPDAGGVVFVPAFTGLGAPYWKPDARGTITGLSRGTTVAHVARAALDSIAFQSAALLAAMSRDGGTRVTELRVDGGAAANDLLMQFQADLLGIPVLRPAIIETTALGAAYLAGLATGVWRDTGELERLWRVERTFSPTMSRDRAASLMHDWERAVRQTIAV